MVVSFAAPNLLFTLADGAIAICDIHITNCYIPCQAFYYDIMYLTQYALPVILLGEVKQP